MQAEPSSPLIFDPTQKIAKCKKKPQLISLNEIYQNNVGSECGYCHNEDQSFSWAFTKKKMEPYTYELLMERGWRRCGTYYYKPNLQKSCCKLYTHRLEVVRFKPKRDQKKAVKRVITLAYEKVQEMQLEKKGKGHEHEKHKKQKPKEKHPQIEIKEDIKAELQKICWKITEYLKMSLGGIIKDVSFDQETLKHMNFDLTNKLKFFTAKPEDKSDYYSNYVMLIHGLNKKIFTHTKHTLHDFAKEVKEGIESLNPIMTFKVEVQRGGYLLFKKVIENSTEFEVLCQKQELKPRIEENSQEKKQKMDCSPQSHGQSGFSKIFSSIKQKFNEKVHGDVRSHEQMKAEDKNAFQILKPDHKYKGQIDISYNQIKFGKLTIDIVPAEENVESFKIYQVYNKQIHDKSEKAMSSYVNFLCLQALEFKQEHCRIQNQKKEVYVPSWDPTCKHQKAKTVTGEVKKLLGCYHMKYILEGKLIGIGVVDMVDDGISSVYFFYDPAYKEYRLGVFSSIIEIEYVRWMRLSFPEFRYYYMGFYIPNSKKMNYKADYMPCQLLCPITYNFVDLTEEVKTKVERISRGEEKDLTLAEKDVQIIGDMHFGKDLGPFIDKTLKLMYNGRCLVLKQINPQFFIHILKILKINVPVWGRTIFDIFTFTV